MDIFIICNADLSEICALEIKELIGKSSEVFPGLCLVKDVSMKESALISYGLQSAIKVGILLNKSLSLDSLKENFAVVDSKSWDLFVKKDSSFAVSTIKTTEFEIPSPDISADIGEKVLSFSKNNNFNLSVNLSHPDISFITFLTKEVYGFGIDLVGVDLSKRPYKLFHNSSSLNGSFAYSVAKYVGLGKDSKVLDPFCGDGVLAVEMSMYQNSLSSFIYERKFLGLRYEASKDAFEAVEENFKSRVTSRKNIFAFSDQLKIMMSAKKNAKIAGVIDGIEFSKVSVDWLDTKFEENSLDLIISSPPKVSKRLNNSKKIDKMFDEFFYQAKFILKKEGLIGLIVFNPSSAEIFAKKHGFEVLESKIVHSGSQKNYIIICQPKKHKI